METRDGFDAFVPGWPRTRDKNLGSVIASFSLVLVLLLSGCAGKKPDVTTQEIRVGDANTATVKGIVIDEATLPVAGAVVGVVEYKVEARTDDKGEFLLAGLAPGKVRLAVHKIGYEQVVRALDLGAGSVHTQTIQLVSIPLPDVPHSEVRIFEGRIVCGEGNPVLTDVICGDVLDENGQKFRFRYLIPKEATGQLWEQAWRPTQILSRELTFILERDGCGVECPSEATLGRYQKCCYIRAAFNDTQMDKNGIKWGSKGGWIQSRTFPGFGNANSPVNVYTDQRFTIYWEQFWGELPADFATTRTNVPES